LTVRVAEVLIAAAAVLAYSNSLSGPFIFDDLDIVDNLAIRQLWPPWVSMFARQNISRPLVALTYAINYAISGLNVWSYHLLNLVIHLMGGLVLFGIVRRTLLQPSLKERFGRRSTELALVVALIWVVHPLQTQAVIYISQRCESLMGLFFLVTVYSAIRAFESKAPAKWFAASITACAAGMLAKQV